MNRVVKILMRRDGLTKVEAQELVQETRDMMADCDYDPQECEDIFMDNLGLEMDYIMDVLG